ncbi:MAG: hypothetical protein AAFR37_07515 [Cyanobacteria bacterium J06628_3]
MSIGNWALGMGRLRRGIGNWELGMGRLRRRLGIGEKLIIPNLTFLI